MGHEFAGDIVKVGKAHQDKFKPGMKFTLQPALNYKGTMWSPGYSYEFFGGDATYCIIPAEVMELGCLLEYKGRAYYEASLAEPMSCSIGAFNAPTTPRWVCTITIWASRRVASWRFWPVQAPWVWVL